MVDKRQLIEQRRAKSGQGKWFGARQVPIYLPIETHEDINSCRNWMAQGNYPLGMSDCEVVGINGDCGEACPAMHRECAYVEEWGLCPTCVETCKDAQCDGVDWFPNRTTL